MTAADLKTAADLVTEVAELAWDITCELDDSELSRARIKQLALQLSNTAQIKLNDALATLDGVIQVARDEMVAHDLASLATERTQRSISA